jgi:hypothetical protein
VRKRTAAKQMRRAAGMVLAVAISWVLLATAAWALVGPVKVLHLPATQLLPSSNDTFLTYTSNSVAHPKRFNAFAYRYADGHTQRINAAHTQGWNGGFDPGTNTVIYQQIAKGSNLYTFSLDTSSRQKLGAIDTNKWEWMPRISASFISFFRDYKANGTWYTGIFLYDRTSGTTQKLATIAAAKHNTINGTLGDRYASWTVCGKTTCTAYVYDGISEILQKIPTNNGKPQYAPAVDEVNGLVFFARSGFGCGKGVTFYQVPVTALGTAPTKVATLPSGIDLDGAASLSLDADTNAYDYFFARVNCSNGSTDIFRLPSVSPGA